MAITSATNINKLAITAANYKYRHNICLVVITSTTTQKEITSAKTWQQHLPKNKNKMKSKKEPKSQYTNKVSNQQVSKKVAGHTNTLTPSVLENNLDQHFPQTRRSHDRILQKLVLPLFLSSVLRESLKVHTGKQNESHPCL